MRLTEEMKTKIYMSLVSDFTDHLQEGWVRAWEEESEEGWAE